MNRFVIMGLPASGKTTFLAALWHMVEAKEVECRLSLKRYDGNLEYLNAIAEAWRTFKPVPRTSQFGVVDVTLGLTDVQTGAEATAFFPDIAGEAFDAQVEARHCRPRFIDDSANEDGILFFISADMKQDGMSVVEFNHMMPETPAAVADSAPPREWEPKHISSQARIVQLLTDLGRRPFSERPRRLAIMLSAWDVALHTGMSPDVWLAANMPLVSQFVRANGQAFQSRIFGVSAQGVSLDDSQAVDGAADVLPSRRVQVVQGEEVGHDLSAPLVWLMSKTLQ